MRPGCCLNGCFRIDQQDIEGFRMLRPRGAEGVEGRIPRSTCHNVPADTLFSRPRIQRAQECAEALAKESLGVFGVASALDINPKLRNRLVPPNSPILHSSP